jgi:serralysin
LRGAGTDTCIGGGGADTFDFNAVSESLVGSSRDVVHFNRAELDKIDLSTIDANTSTTSTNQAFKFIGTAAFTSAGQLRYDTSTGVLQANTGGTLAADLEVKLVGVTSMQAGDFIL